MISNSYKVKNLIILILISISAFNIHAQTHEKSSTKAYNFEINYWLNMHHFLWMESFMNIEKDSTIIHKKIPQASKEKLNNALDYYKKNLAQLDLKRNDYMSAFKVWVTTEGRQLDAVPDKFKEHIAVLKSVSSVYKESFWPKHKETCKNVLNNNIELIRRTEGKFRDRMTKLSRQFWQFKKIKVDITYYGLASAWNLKHRSYTSLFPTHVVMKAEGEDKVKGNWLEILYHESTHHLILGSSYFVGGTIKDVIEVLKIKTPPRQLAHAFHFYITGELTKQLLNEEDIPYNDTYMQREGVFSWSYKALDKFLKSYINREITLEEATKEIIAELAEE